MRYVAEQLKSAKFINSHAAVPGLSREQAYALPFLLPQSQVMDGYAESANDIFGLAEALGQINQCLSGERDFLLPKLVSGQIDVSKFDLDELVGSVT